MTPREAVEAGITAERERLFGIAYVILGNRADAEDALQNAFVNLLAYADNFDVSQPFFPYAWKIVRNEAIRIKTKRGREIPMGAVADELANSKPSQSEADQGGLFDDALPDKLRDCLARLTETERRRLKLRYVDGLSYAQIAEQEGISVQGVDMCLIRARRRLRQCLTVAAR